MYIERIELQNIKSYGSKPMIVEFGEGVNLIAGTNGAGKSTILEAIGFALFDALPYSQNDFVRRGKSGKSRVVVRIRSSYDDRRYDIERTVNPSSYAIYDVEENFKENLESKDEALEWLKQHLKVEQTTDLTSLFDNAVGMQQGTITAVFLERASKRKETFDALLRVEDYDDAWTNLRETENYIKDLTTENEKALAVTENTIETFKNKPKEADTVQDKIELDRQELDTVATDITRLDSELHKLDELSKKTQETARLQQDLKKAQSNYENQETHIAQLLPQVEERSQLADKVNKLGTERGRFDEILRQFEEERKEIVNIVERAQTVFDIIDEDWKKFKEI